MSWSSPELRFGALTQRALVLSATLALGGCLQPLYGTLNGGLASQLQAIAVDPIPDRVGHYLGNDLIFALNGTGSDVPPLYHLKITLKQTVQSPLIDSFTGRASAATVVTEAAFRLIETTGSTILTSGTAVSAATYDRSGQSFANVRAGRDAEIRNAHVLAEQIQTRLAAFLASRS